MALGFHKSLFGYNCDEVTEYVHKTIAANQEIQNSLNVKIKDAEKEIAELKQSTDKLKNEKSEIESQLIFYKEKYEEIKTLSENIGKLYLVAQTNANAIINAAELSKEAADNEVSNNIATIDATNASLNQMKEYISEITSEFMKKVDELNSSLVKTKVIIESASKSSQNSKQEFDAIFENITKK